MVEGWRDSDVFRVFRCYIQIQTSHDGVGNDVSDGGSDHRGVGDGVCVGDGKRCKFLYPK